MAEQTLTLSTLKAGALEERFQRELARVLENIRDPNTAQDSTRRIDIQLSFKPADDRQFAAVTARVSARLAPDKPLTTYTLFASDDDGLMVAVEQVPARGDDPRQSDLIESAGGGKVTPISSKTKPRKDRG